MVLKFLTFSKQFVPLKCFYFVTLSLNPYCKLVETFHVVSECKIAIYFSWFLIQALAQPVQLFLLLVTFSVASIDSLTDSDSDWQLFIETEQDQTRHSLHLYNIHDVNLRFFNILII